jgi:nucleotide-binding universal stress UspA family protein
MMDNTYRIVVGVDGSVGGRLALAWAVNEAVKRGGTVEAVIAWHWDGVRRAPIVDVSSADAKQHATEILDRELAAINAAASPANPIAGMVVAGTPADVLIRAATGADLLVLGSHGHGHLRHAVLGSVSEQCIRRAPCPVVVIPVPIRHESTQPPVAVG